MQNFILRTSISFHKDGFIITHFDFYANQHISMPALGSRFLFSHITQDWNLFYHHLVMQSLSRAFRTNCLFALFQEFESDAFISALRRDQLFVCPNDYLFCTLRNDSTYDFAHLPFSVAVSFVFCNNAVVSDFCRFRKNFWIP